MKKLRLLLAMLCAWVGMSAWGQESTVTLTFNFNGDGWTVQRTKQVAAGAAIPAATEFIKVDGAYYSVSGYPTGNAESDETYNITVSQNLPFDAANDYDHIVWHSLWLKGNMLNANVGDDAHINANGSTTVNNTDDLNKKMWGFVGNVVEGFKIFNRYTGSTKILSCNKDTWDGNTGANTFPVLTNISDVESDNTKEMYYIPSPGHSAYPGGFYLGGYTYNQKMNNRNGKLAFWNQDANDGSTFLAYSSEAFQLSDVPVEGAWAANTHWYVIKAKNGRYLTSAATDTNVKQAEWATAPTPSDFSALWCVTGSSSEGYVLYNRAHGTSEALAFNEGNADANDSKFTPTGMRLYTVPGKDRINGMADHKGGYVCIRKSNANDAVNFIQPCGGANNGFIMGTWNAIGNLNDPASNYQFVDIKDFYAEFITETTSKKDQFVAAINAGAAYFVPSADAVEALTAAIAAAPAPSSLVTCEDVITAYNALKSAVDAFDANVEANTNLDGKYVLMGNKLHTTLYVSAPDSHTGSNTAESYGTGLGSRATLAWDAVWKLEKNENGTYCIYNEFKNKYVGEIPGNDANTGNDKRISLVDTKDDAGKYQVAMSSDNGYVYFKTTKSNAVASRDCLHMTNWDGVVRWSETDAASHFLLKDADSWAATTQSNALITRAKAIVENQGSGRLQYTNIPENMASLTSALQEAKSSYAAYTALNTAVGACTINTTGDINTGVYYTIRMATTDGSIKYLAANYGAKESGNGTPEGYAIGSTTTIVPNTIWKLEKMADKDRYNFVTNGQYMSGFANAKARMVDKTNSEIDGHDPVHSLGEMNIVVDAAAGTAKINCTNNNKSNNLTVDNISDFYFEQVKSFDLNISAAKYATAYWPMDVKLPAGVKAWYGVESGVDNDNQVITLTPLHNDNEETVIIPANTGVILYSDEPGTKTFAIADVDERLSNSDRPTSLAITGSLTPYSVNTANKDVFILKNGGSGIGLYKVTENSTIAANKAFLVREQDSQVRSFTFKFDNSVTTGIEEAVQKAVEAEQTIYDLNGRRVNQMGRGLYIVNGKKVVKY